MTTPLWLTDPYQRTGDLTDRLLVDPLSKSVLHHFVAELPGPKNETDAARAARFEAQLAEMLSYNPRNAAEAMLASHCILFRLVADAARRDAIRAGTTPAEAKRHQRSARQFDKLVTENQQLLADFQARPLGVRAPAIVASPGPNNALTPDPAPVANDAEEAFSAVIVPLHPAPKMLQ